MKNRSIKQKLVLFRIYLLTEKHYAGNTTKHYLSKVKTIYRHFEIQLPYLPPFKIPPAKKVSFEELPTNEIIAEAYKIVKQPVMKAIILFMVSSGCGRAEVLNLTIKDFIRATKEYYNEKDIYQALENLKKMDEIIPTWYLTRQKTSNEYFTFCSPEATKEIINYLLGRKDPLHDDTKLFKIIPPYFVQLFIDLNKMLGDEVIGDGFNRFRSHNLRKFHATQLLNAGLSEYIVDALQGRKQSKVHIAYFKNNPQKVKERYIEYLKEITIFDEINSLNIKSPEYMKLETENTTLKTELSKLDEIMSRLNKLEEKQ